MSDKEFPEDRIRFAKDATSAYLDKCTFERWRTKELTTEEAAHEIARHNKLEEVPIPLFLKTAGSLGYVRKN